MLKKDIKEQIEKLFDKHYDFETFDYRNQISQAFMSKNRFINLIHEFYLDSYREGYNNVLKDNNSLNEKTEI